MTTATPPNGSAAGAPDSVPEAGPDGRTGATASERAAAQAVRDLSESERLDGSRGSA